MFAMKYINLKEVHNVLFGQYDDLVVFWLKPQKHFFLWENNIFEAIFPKFRKKTCFAFHFPALETLFLEHSKSVKMTRKSQI